MKLKFYGTRGSIPICDAGFQQCGENITCLQVTLTDPDHDDEFHLRIEKRCLERFPNTVLARAGMEIPI
jgi:hypothetical protein